MIWFACKQCGKRHGRADSLSGTLVFCDCGFGNRVPWSSTVPEPDVPEEAPPPPKPPPRPAWSPPPEDRDDRPPPGWAPVPPRRRELRRINPAFCLNHDETASEQTCAACRQRFCSSCVVTLRGETLCGPCKNFKVRGLHRPSRVAPLAVVATVIALVSGPTTLILTVMALGWHHTGEGGNAGPVFLCVLGLVLPAAGLALGGLALREIETKPNVGGRSLALTGASAGLVGVLWGLTMAGLFVVKHLQG